jgi:hypothetical protein
MDARIRGSDRGDADGRHDSTPSHGPGLPRLIDARTHVMKDGRVVVDERPDRHAARWFDGLGRRD